MFWILTFVIVLLVIALVAFFLAIYREVKVDLHLHLPAGIRLRLSGKK